jgi:hypothetical protein
VGRRAASYNHGLEAHTTLGRPPRTPGLSRDSCFCIPAGGPSRTRRPERTPPASGKQGLEAPFQNNYIPVTIGRGLVGLMPYRRLGAA